MHEVTSVADMKRLYGAIIDAAIKGDVPGMEIGTQHKYAFNILLDFKPEEAPLRPEVADIMRQRLTNNNPADPCGAFFGFPLAGLLSEPIKMIQSPPCDRDLVRSQQSTSPNLQRRTPTAEGIRLSGLFALLGWALGGATSLW